MSNIGSASDGNGVVDHGDDIVHERPRIEKGHLYPPSGPGLGVTLDPARMERYRIR
jgi:L-alanine-DL-glutamate epimerase-like enolase superfamily enzyme